MPAGNPVPKKKPEPGGEGHSYITPQDVKEAITASQILFSARPYLARAIVPLLRKGDLEVAYARLMRQYIGQRYAPVKKDAHFDSKSLSTLAKVYDILNRYLHMRTAVSEEIVPTDKGFIIPVGRENEALQYYTGRIPPRKMRFSEFLYYRGAVSRLMIEQSLLWQKNKRPLLGQIAVRKGLLDVHDFARVLVHLRAGELFGDVAVRMEAMRAEDLATILREQREYGFPVGKYYVENGILSGEQVLEFLQEMNRHNSRFT